MPATHAYIRISTSNQCPDAQRHGVLEYCNNHQLANVQITVDVCSGAVKPKNRKLGSLIQAMDKGDRLIVTEISRLGRNMHDIIVLLESLKVREIDVHIIKQGLILSESGNPVGKMMIAMYSVFAEMERDLIVARVKEGLANAKANGKRLGRPKGAVQKLKLDAHKDVITTMVNNRVSAQAIGRTLNVSPKTVRLWVARNLDNQTETN